MVMRDGHAGTVAGARGVPTKTASVIVAQTYVTPPLPSRKLKTLVFPGTYTDSAGTEAIEWRIESDRPNSRVPDYLIHTTIRGGRILGHRLRP